jgi:hypothetical protein
MHLLSEIPYIEIELCWDRELDGAAEIRARQLRGSLAQRFSEDPLFHQRDEEGRVLYRYPQVQYRWRDGRGVVAGWGEAARRLPQLPWLELDLSLGDDRVLVSDIRLVTQKARFAISPRLLRYRLATPVLLFNQKNYRHYRELERSGQRNESDRLLIAQLLTALRGLQVQFDDQLYAAFVQSRTCVSHYKQQELVGVLGQFVCNAVLPAGFAIGHGVSHGFGWIEPD